MTSVSEDVEKLELSHTSCGSVKGCSHFGKQSGNSSRLNTKLLYDPTIPLPKEMKTYVDIKTHTQMFIVELFVIAKKWKHSKCPLTCEWINKCGLSIQGNIT